MVTSTPQGLYTNNYKLIWTVWTPPTAKILNQSILYRRIKKVIYYFIHIVNLSQSIFMSDRADTIITLPPTKYQKLFKYLRVDLYPSVIHYWNHLLKPILFLHINHMVNWGHYSHPLSDIGFRDVFFSCRISQSDSQTYSKSIKPNLVSLSNLVSHSKINSQFYLISQTLIVISVIQAISLSLFFQL